MATRSCRHCVVPRRAAVPAMSCLSVPWAKPSAHDMAHGPSCRAESTACRRQHGSTGSRRRSAWQSGRTGGGASGRSQGWSTGGSGRQVAAPAGSVSGRRRCVYSALVGSSGWRARRLGAELSRALALAATAGWSSALCPQGGGVSPSWAPGARTGRGAPQRGWLASGRRCNCHGDSAACGSRAGHYASPLALPRAYGPHGIYIISI
jgi:hypothetical protein